ncbi:hypothetical protein NLM33_03450 [Bradyrhizobium sp. CCGUVB1N3]|uniref:DUF7638 domain-containing protein n=1 Tax=Bradyrhizobium sp. CCGUVB1N3 TaxID=2949629 RepID=UPI0020B1D519|nr:hypothetical protein [Bradyrhizobium sp. CCGUVB1N3]MCP3469380.1 hypothetical protein [Bradyrhizobium sp. CCGUVB1N3]
MWSSKSDQSQSFESWPIVRSQPAGRTYGRSISLFINNMECHLTTVDVYEDGSIDCWGFVDRALFKTKVGARWVVSGQARDQLLSVFNFGAARVNDAKWFQPQHRIVEQVDAIIGFLNPSMQGLIDMHGSDVELRGKVHTAKMGLSDKKAFRIADATNEEILADSVPVLKLTNRGAQLTRLFVFADGLLRIGPNGDLFPLEELSSRYVDGEICNQISAGSLIELPGLGEFRPADVFGFISVHDRIGEVHDVLDKLNGGPGAVRRCAQAFTKYEREPTPQMKDALRAAYEAVPEHLRCYCGDMDTRDTAIRKVLFG